MSVGDEIMASGHAHAEYLRTGKRVRILDKRGRPRWSDLWEGLDWIVRPGEPCPNAVAITNGMGCRPYIVYPFTRESGCRFSGWRVRDHVGALTLSADDRAAAKQFLGLHAFTDADLWTPAIVVEPHVPPKSNQNKQWGWDRWQELTDRLIAAGFRVVQPGMAGARPLDGALFFQCSFREAAALIEITDGAALPEGGLHHAAGAMRQPAVVLFGGCVDVEATGYPWHDNIVDGGPGSPCGQWAACGHCEAIWNGLTPEHILGRLTAQFEASK